jgi:hypothetical protein
MLGSINDDYNDNPIIRQQYITLFQPLIECWLCQYLEH